MALILVIYLIPLLCLRPFEEEKNNVVEILNEVVFSVLLGILFYANTGQAWTKLFSSLYTWIMTGNSVILVLILTGNYFSFILNSLLPI